MKHVLVAAISLVLLAPFPAIAVDNSIQNICRADVPGTESYRRPGGYCDHIASNDSLNPGAPGTTTTCEPWEALIHHECVCVRP